MLFYITEDLLYCSLFTGIIWEFVAVNLFFLLFFPVWDFFSFYSFIFIYFDFFAWLNFWYCYSFFRKKRL